MSEPTLRQIMTNKIKNSGWLDYSYNRDEQPIGSTLEEQASAYTAWLDTLTDENFLSAYDRVQEADRNLED